MKGLIINRRVNRSKIKDKNQMMINKRKNKINKNKYSKTKFSLHFKIIWHGKTKIKYSFLIKK